MTSMRIIDHPGFSMDPNGSTGGGIISPERLQAAEAADKLAQLEANKASRPLQQEAAQMQIEQARRGLSVAAQNEFVEKGVTTGRGAGIMQFISVDRPAMLADIRAKNQAGDTEGARSAYARLRELTDQVGPGLSAVANYSGANPLVSAMAAQAKNASMYLLGDDQAEHQKEMDMLDARLNPNSVAFSTTRNLKDNPSLSVEDARIKAEAENPAASSEARAQYDVLNKLGVYGEPTVVAGPDGKRRVVQAAPSEDAAPAAAFHKTLVPKLAASGQLSQEEAIKTSGQITGALVKTQLGKNNWSSVFESAKAIVGGLPPDQIVGAIDEVSTGLSAVMDSIKVKDPEGKVYVNPLEQATLQQFATKAFESSVKSLTAGLTYTPGDSAQRAAIISKASTSLAKLNAEFKQMGIAEDMATDANAKYAGEIAAYRTGTNRSVLSDGAQTLLSKIELARKMAGNAPIASPMQEALGGAEPLSGLARSTETALQKHIMRAVVTGGDSTPTGVVGSLDAAAEPIAQEIATRYGLSMDQTRPLADAYIAAKKIDPNVTVDAVGVKLQAPSPTVLAQAAAEQTKKTPKSDILARAAEPKHSLFFDDEGARVNTFIQGLTSQLTSTTGPMSLNTYFTLADLASPTDPKTTGKIDAFVRDSLIPNVIGLSELVAKKPELKSALQSFVAEAFAAHSTAGTTADAVKRAHLAGLEDQKSLWEIGFPIQGGTLTNSFARQTSPSGGKTTSEDALRTKLLGSGSFTEAGLVDAVRSARRQAPVPKSPVELQQAKQAEQALAFGGLAPETINAAAQTASLVKERMNLPLATVLGKKAIAECDKTIAYLTNVAPASGAEAQGILLQMLSDGEEAKNPAAFVKKFNTKIAEILKEASRLVIQNAASKAMVMQQSRNGELPLDYTR